MKTAIATLRAASPYMQSKFHETPKLDKESADAYEERTWREKAHTNERGEAQIPPYALKNCLAEAAKFLSKSIPGKGKATWTKHFLSGVLVSDPMPLGVKKGDFVYERIYCNSDGVKGSGKRVFRKFPVFHNWTGEVTFYVLDETITPSVFKEHLEEAGRFIGMGAFRVRNGGFSGRFSVEKVIWEGKEI